MVTRAHRSRPRRPRPTNPRRPSRPPRRRLRPRRRGRDRTQAPPRTRRAPRPRRRSVPRPRAGARARRTRRRATARTREPGEAGRRQRRWKSITNNQHAEVDEGDIVKLHGEHLVVLRRGRLFTISLDGDRPKQSKMLDAFGPDIEPRGSWYDEMVIDGDNIVVVGFSYARGGTEIGLFKIDREGGLTYRATYHLKSNDYYSARNYASRIVDGRLIFYAPLRIAPQSNGRDLSTQFPAVRKWHRAGTSADFVTTLVPSKLYHMDGEFPATPVAALHSVTSCDLRDPSFPCQSVALVGPAGRVFYVSPQAVYVWMQDPASRRSGDSPKHNGLLARLPIGRRGTEAPSALRVSGMPTDQFSFDEDDSGNLDVLVRAQSNGDEMFASDRTAGAAALLRVPVNMFGDTVLNVSSKRYRVLPRPDGGTVQNRFVGGWLLYGSGAGGYRASHTGGHGQLFAVKVAAPDEPPTTLDLDQGVDRIEPMGDDAVIVGSRGSDLVFTPLELGASKEAHARRDYVRKNASQGELRSHGFFYKPGKNPREGLIGLPIRSEGASGSQYITEGSASVLFLQTRSLDITELGSLRASRVTTNHDGCRASCADWYGNARPIFAKGRMFALMGYDLVEGTIEPAGRIEPEKRIEDQGRTAHIVERARLNFAPRGDAPVDELDD
ncbi:MAG: beta-propeller domain-containing protein [Labilithrix sp.]